MGWLWKSIRMGWGEFLNHFKCEVGDGTRINFWDEIWCEDLALKNVYTSLFRIARDQYAAGADSFNF